MITSRPLPRFSRTTLATLMSGAALLAGCGGSDQPDTTPLMHIVSPQAGNSVARGEGVAGTGSFNGAGFSINLEMITRDAVGIGAEEGLNIRNTSLLGQPNPKFSTLVVTVDADLIKPDGTLIPSGTNLASLFNIAGSDDTPGPGITVWAGWGFL